eukprot:NODE_626_length_1752_cov_58.515692_g616_i0.p1 GENE.NODE_626_length_1752_cov_58.515692_g616_i0~~NODE_626_length_1752_cov_58.515692_g616_i0.p1  ORF type:complete len:508 (+),score=64.02 NODE_626_length_1752_cov_58.515692_g616_i0:128-1651(+)
MLVAILVCLVASGLCQLENGFPELITVDWDPNHIWVEVGTAFDAEIEEERTKATLLLEGHNLANGLLVSFRVACNESHRYGTYEDQDMGVVVYDVPDHPADFYYGRKGKIDLHQNMTHTAYAERKICITTTIEQGDYYYNDTGFKVTMFEIDSVANIWSVQRKHDLIDQIRAFKYSTVTYLVTGTGLSERLQLSLQYRCKYNAFTIPIEGETPANLFWVNYNGTEAYVTFSRAQTDLEFDVKDICVNRGSPTVYDFSGWVGVTMSVIPDCVEDPCHGTDACDRTNGQCMCTDDELTWFVCPGEDRNITSYLNQTERMPEQPPMCKDVKWEHFEPDLAKDQYYVINPSGEDTFAIWCDMEDGGWSSFNATYVETQQLCGGGEPQWLTYNISYDITAPRMWILRNLSLYGKQEAITHCQADYSDFVCPREPYHTIHEGLWLEYNGERLWPVYEFDGCCYGCCAHSALPHQSQSRFWSINLPILNVRTYWGAADDNCEQLRIEMQPMKFY